MVVQSAAPSRPVAIGAALGYSSALKIMGATPMPHATFIRFVTLFLAAAIGMGLQGGARAASDLDRAYRTIAGKKFVDLTHSFAPDTPVWSGFGQARMTPAVDPKTRDPYTIPKDGFRTTYYEMV